MDQKKIIGKGLGAGPPGLIWLLTGGLESGEAVVLEVHPMHIFTVPARGRAITVPTKGRAITVPQRGRVIRVEPNNNG